MYSECIGILGVCSYATAHFFKRLLDAFPGEKEWDRPQIIINNDCTIPSRVRAILYGENVEQLKREMTECALGILRCAGDRKVKIIITCNTAHHYIKHLQRKLPQAEFVNIIEICADKIASSGIRQVTVLASEGVMGAKIYDQYFSAKGIDVTYPLHLMKDIRYLIESVKGTSKNSLRQPCGLPPPSKREASKCVITSPPHRGGCSEAAGGSPETSF